MRSTSAESTVSIKQVWAGRIISALLVLFFVFDGVVKVLQLQPAIEGTARLGYPISSVLPIGIVQLASIILYALPRTDVLGAILVTGYLGGATATQVRMQDPWFLFPVVLGVLAWAGLLLRNSRLRALLPADTTGA